jgi:hypothetical protein
MSDYPAMLTLCGQVANVFTTPTRTNEKGETYGGEAAVQLLARVPVENGETQHDLVTLKTDRAPEYRALSGRWVRVVAGVWARGGAWGFFAIKGQSPEVLDVGKA